jgi:hypothetical protein
MIAAIKLNPREIMEAIANSAVIRVYIGRKDKHGCRCGCNGRYSTEPVDIRAVCATLVDNLTKVDFSNPKEDIIWADIQVDDKDYTAYFALSEGETNG